MPALTSPPAGAKKDQPGNELPPLTGAPREIVALWAGPLPLATKAKALPQWWSKTQLGRTLTRFSSHGGGVLTGGIAYATLFSVGAGLTLAFTFVVGFLDGHPDVKDQVFAAISGALPGVVDTGSGGLISPAALQVNTGLHLTSIIAAGVLVLTAMSAVGALTTGVRQIFGQAKLPAINPVVQFAAQLGGFVGIGLAILASSAVSIFAAGFAADIMDSVGLHSASLVVQISGIVVGGAIDAATFMMIIRLVARIQVPGRALWPAAILAGLGLGTVRVLGVGIVAGGAARNPLLASVAVIATLLLWINLNSRIILTAAAWAAEDYWELTAHLDPARAGAGEDDQPPATCAATAPTAAPAATAPGGRRLLGAFAAGAGVAAALAVLRDRRRRHQQ